MLLSYFAKPKFRNMQPKAITPAGLNHMINVSEDDELQYLGQKIQYYARKVKIGSKGSWFVC